MTVMKCENEVWICIPIIINLNTIFIYLFIFFYFITDCVLPKMPQHNGTNAVTSLYILQQKVTLFINGLILLHSVSREWHHNKSEAIWNYHLTNFVFYCIIFRHKTHKSLQGIHATLCSGKKVLRNVYKTQG